MKSIINGLLYDTDISELIYMDKYKGRIYYKTPNNNYFVLYGTGEIVPTIEDNVKDILGKNDIEKYIELFGKVKEA